MDTRGAQPRFFDLWSRFYDVGWVQRTTYWPVHDAVVSEVRRGECRRLLDVGCGTGQLTARLRREFPGAQTIGCDFSGGMLERARARDEAVDWVRSDGMRLCFPSGSFDTVLSTEAFHWFPDPDAALAEFHRILAPKGRLLVAFVNPPIAAVGRIARFVSQQLGEPLHWPTPQGMRRHVESAGFRVVRQRRIARPVAGLLLPPVLTVAVR